VTVRVRFAPSPTGSLHLGNALTAVANRRFADAHGGTLTLRIDDTDAARRLEGGEAALVSDLEWLGIAWDRGPVRQSERGAVHAAAAHVAEREGGAVRDADGSLRLDGVTLVRPDGTATYQLATVADDLEMGITHIIRGSDHRPNEVLQERIARAIGSVLPEVIHHGLLLGDDGKKLSKRHGHAAVGDLRDDGIPAAAVRAYLDELGLPAHDVHLDRARIGRLAVETIAAMPDDELAGAAGAPPGVARALRGSRTLVEARAMAKQIAEPTPVVLPAEALPTLDRFVELRGGAPDTLAEADARAIVRELKAVGGDLRALRLALTGASRGPELWSLLAVLPAEEALQRVHRARGGH
jgi:glutamyl/glutaminyl-tRNA synthetase